MIHIWTRILGRKAVGNAIYACRGQDRTGLLCSWSGTRCTQTYNHCGNYSFIAAYLQQRRLPEVTAAIIPDTRKWHWTTG